VNYSIIITLHERQMCAGGHKSRTEKINGQIQRTQRSQAILDYVHRSMKNDDGKLKNDTENNSIFTPGRKRHAQVSTETKLE